MRQRLARVSGRLEIESTRHEGTAVSASVPASAGAGAVIRVLVVDDHPVVRDGLCGVLAGEEDIEVVGEAANGAEARGFDQLARLTESTESTSSSMDLRMPSMGGVEAIRELRQIDPAIRILVLTTFDADLMRRSRPARRATSSRTRRVKISCAPSARRTAARPFCRRRLPVA